MSQNYFKHNNFLVKSDRLNPPIVSGNFKSGAELSQKRFKLMLFVLIVLVIATFKLFYDLTRIDSINTQFKFDISHQNIATKYLKRNSNLQTISTEIKQGQLHSFVKLPPFELVEYAIDINKAIAKFCPSKNDKLGFKFPTSQWQIFIYSRLKTDSLSFEC
ncbi:hypothetical protein KO527_02185 [Pseudoalteromonas sp. C2R02]|uniref:hypothetical protein n=1 Tax=Pseudoalteromonas sp. C2R02 TaxID=2841565 RepID=UPI001C08E44C|nr:hypothetical protein [Pseudoalteromonas sp. C2R02]MBU2968164.1 hypothetical protein [Pseudoalteromonas sp. C2R02]